MKKHPFIANLQSNVRKVNSEILSLFLVCYYFFIYWIWSFHCISS